MKDVTGLEKWESMKRTPRYVNLNPSTVSLKNVDVQYHFSKMKRKRTKQCVNSDPWYVMWQVQKWRLSQVHGDAWEKQMSDENGFLPFFQEHAE
jgi:hypothetical protein